MKNRPRIVMGLLVLMLLSQYLAAQTLSFNLVEAPPSRPITGWISAITQDNQGYLWFSSSYALHRYDGYEVVTYAHDASTSNSLPPGNIESVYADRQGYIWIGSQFSGLARLDPRTNTFTHYEHDTNDESSLGNNFISCIIEDRDNNLWVGTHGGLDRLDRNTGKFTHYRHIPGDSNSLSNDQVRVLYEDRQGTVWVGTGSPFFDESPTGSGGLNRLDKAGGTFTRYLHDPDDTTSLMDNKVRALFEDSQGTFWVGTAADGLHTMNREKGVFQRYVYTPGDPEKLSAPHLQRENGNEHLFGTTSNVISFITEVNGEIWIGSTSGGINRYNLATKTLTHYEPGTPYADGLQTYVMWCALKTRDGTLFLGTCTNGQLYRVNPSPFHVSYHETPIAPTTFHKNSSGNLFLGTTSGGLNLLDKNGTLKNISHLVGLKSDDWVHVMLADRNGVLWIGTRVGLIAYDEATKRTKHYRHSRTDNTSIASDSVTALFEDRQGNLWVGTAEGLELMNKERDTFFHYTHDPSDPNTLAGSRVVDVLEDRKGNLWVVTRWSWNLGVLNKLDRNTGKVKQYPNFAGVVSIAEDSSYLWIASRNNLCTMDLDTEKVTRFTDPQTGEGIMSIQNIFLDKHRNLWVNTPGGLLQIPRSLNKVRRFVTSAGNNASGSYQGKRCFYESASGEVYFSNLAGYYSFNAGHLPSPDTTAPLIVFHDFKIGSATADQPEKVALDNFSRVRSTINLTHEQDGFSVNFAGIHFSQPEANKHLFKLDGYDKAWHQPISTKTAYYYSLPPGRYNFRVKAANGDGVWAERSLAIVIHPPWWRTWWAYSLYVAAFAVIMIVFVRYRIRLQQEELLQERKDWEARQLKEVDEMKTRFFSNITHEFRTPLSLIIPAAEQLMKELTEADHLKKLAVVKRQAGQLLHLINQLLDLSKLEGGSMTTVEQRGDIFSFTNQVVDSFRPAFEDKGIDLEMDCQSNGSACYFDADKLEKIINNLVSNALKFTPVGGKIKVVLEMIDGTSPGDHSVKLIVEDNGMGIDPNKLPYIFDRFYQADNSRTRSFEGTGIGLALVKEMVELLKGTVRVESAVGQGTKFTINLPVRKAESEGTELVTPPQSFVPSIPATKASTLPLQSQPDENAPLILVVEDHLDLREFIAESLGKSYRVLTAATGKQGLALSQEQLPDIIISDVMMPEMDGFELTNLIKQNPDTNHIAVMLLTAKAAHESRLAGLSFGADDYLTKPFHFDELALRIRNIINRQQKLQHRYQEQLKLDTPALAETVQDKFWQSVCDAIETHLDNPLFDVDMLAASVNTSRRTLYRKLATLTGLKPNEVVRDYRLKRAKQFLSQGYSVSETAYRVGFESPSYFGKCFKETYQTTPSDYLQHQMAQMRE